MREYDFHGMTVEEALKKMETIIGDVRIDGNCEDVRIITGRGPIRNAILKLCDEYDFDHDFELGNDGALYITIE